MTTQGCEMPIFSASGTHYRLNPSFDDLLKIEQKLDTTLLKLAKKTADGEISVNELAVILENSLEEEVRHGDIKSHILESGITHALQAVTSLMVCILSGYANKNQAD